MTPGTAITVLWVAWVVSWGVAALWSNRTEKAGGLADELAFRIPFWVGAALLLAPFTGRHFRAQVQLWQLDEPMKWTLVALAAVGFSFVWWARIHLGRLWSAWMTKKAGHHVVDTGPYRLVRHPIYSGLILAAFATALQEGTSFAMLGVAIFAFAFYTKARREESFLRVELGEGAYDSYARKTAMLLPFAGRPRT